MMPDFRVDWPWPASGVSASAGMDPTPEAHPAVAANDFLDLLRAGRLEEAWPLADVEWQRQRISTWLGYLQLPAPALDEEISAAFSSGPRPWWWDAFLEVDGRLVAHELKHFDPARWAPGDRPRAVGVDRELVIFLDTGGRRFDLPEGQEPTGPRIEVIMHLVDGRWLAAEVTPAV